MYANKYHGQETPIKVDQATAEFFDIFVDVKEGMMDLAAVSVVNFLHGCVDVSDLFKY